MAAMIGDRWNVTDAEVARRYPCDSLVTRPTLQAWRAITIDGHTSQVWPWIAQIRLAPYSYDWIDNLGQRSPRVLIDLPGPAVGEHFTTAAGRRVGHILSVEPGVQLTGAVLGATMSYVLVPDGSRTRLLLKVLADTRPTIARLLCLGDLFMARRQLRTFAQLATGSSHGS